MKRLKKMAVVLTAAAMMMSMGMTTYAENITQKDGTASADVKGTYNETAAITYNVDLRWDGMDFTYNKNGIWNPAKHTYEGKGAWSGEAAITATNHSNAKVSLNFEFAKNDNIGGSYKALLKKSTDNSGYVIENAYRGVDLNSAAGEEYLGKPDAAPNVIMNMIMSGTPEQFTTGASLGTLKVSFYN